jgi:tetratricopeptide (TPR) repeat protein
VRLALAVLLVVVTDGAALAQNRDPRLDRVQQWLKAVMRHEAGTVDDEASLVGSWGNNAVRTLWVDTNILVQLTRNPKGVAFSVRGEGEVRAQPIRYTSVQLRRMKVLACAAGGRIGDVEAVCGDAADELDPDLMRLAVLSRAARLHGDDNFILRRGALLHADIAMLMAPAAEPIGTSRGPGPGRIRLYISDGLGVDLGLVATHWEIARMLLDDVRPTGANRPAPGRDEMVRQWYRATAAWMQRRESHDTVHLDRARAIFPADPDILFLSGCQRETYAAPHIQSAVRSAVLPSGFSIDVGSPRTELRQAESFFRRALALKPDVSETRLRLGRVLALLGRHADAANELRQAIASTDDPLLVYYGDLFLGAEEEALGQYDAGRDAYERAAALYPTAQSPLLGLSELARRQGDRPAALRALQRVFDLPSTRPERIDPWWSYHVAQARNADELLEDLRASFRGKQP